MGACCAKSRADSIDLHAELGTAARPRDADVTRNPLGAVAEQANHVGAAETPAPDPARKPSVGLRPETLEFFEHAHGIMRCIDAIGDEWADLALLHRRQAKSV